jgi:hypothetical protein
MSAATHATNPSFLEFSGVGQVYATRRGSFEALRDINLQVMVHHPLAAGGIELRSGSLHCQMDVLPDRFPRQQ